jgi:hypothetical protein
MKLHIWSYFVFLVILLNLYACRQQKSTMVESTSASISRNLPYEIREIRKTDGDCESPNAPCVILSIMYPIVSSGTEAAQEKINNDIETLVSTKMQRYTSEQLVETTNLDSIGEAFINRFNQLLIDFPEYQQRWSYNLEGSIAYDSADIITIEFNLYTYTGGAHPNAEVTYDSYDAQNGERLQLTDIVSDVDKLAALAEEKFRQQKELLPDADLSEAGYTFENNQFALNENFGVLEEGIIFYYNDYEIAPYVMGPTEILLTYEEVGNLLKI